MAAGVNGGVGLVLLRGGRRLRSAALRADGHHLLTGVWASAGMVAGVFLMWLTGWLILNPLIALVVAGNIVRVGARLLNNTAHGLLDSALPPPNKRSSPTYSRDTKGRASSSTPRGPGPPARRFVSMHVLVPGEWNVKRVHDLSERIETDIVRALPMTTGFINAKPLEDPVSWQDQDLDRPS